jgi:hypothetical protein
MKQHTAECPNGKNHTRCPDGYVAWHEWAEKKLRTHQAVRCPSCGRYSIWIPKVRKVKEAGP